MPDQSASIRLPLRDDADARVAELLRNIAEACRRQSSEDYNQSNKRLAEEFLAQIERDFPGRCIARRQPIPTFHIRTTDSNYIFTVPGRSENELVLVAHFDTWRGPGADDNTTGEEVLKQYLLEDLRRAEPPPLTHTYILAGSEECGLIGFVSQCLLAAGLVAANLSYQSGSVIEALIALIAIPLAKYRFGVAGSRVYVQSLSPDELARTQAVIAVDSVGEGRMYVPSTSLGADFVRAFIPFPGYDRLNDLLEEAAHLHGIKYNRFLSGGTTDHVSWLEVNNSLLDWVREHLGGKKKLKVPAAALITMCPGKASPFVFGGKIHTPADTADRVYPEPLRQTLHVLDYFFHIFEGGAKPSEPRTPEDCHYARLYAAGSETYLVLKDAVEPNRRNLNMIYRVEAGITEDGPNRVARVRIGACVRWGVETSMDEEIANFLAGKENPSRDSEPRPTASRGRPQGSGGLNPSRDRERAVLTACRRIPLTEIHVENGPTFWRRFGLIRSLRAAAHSVVGHVAEWMGRYSFLIYFLAAYLVAEAFNMAMDAAFWASPEFAVQFFRFYWATIPFTVALEFGLITYLFVVAIPTVIDNSYRHLNRADNLLSLKRARKQGAGNRE
ncbi:MAG: hypothetical protein A3H28_11995 [Acidobacteria bacterium RIFCSPLOWO2_02_FULL_61_28]|nr:MAG: hypothetical protein A3H28_11995 [Acidobacteria bacterium RIFCSPLOWO2_02_FULL_61_28]